MAKKKASKLGDSIPKGKKVEVAANEFNTLTRLCNTLLQEVQQLKAQNNILVQKVDRLNKKQPQHNSSPQISFESFVEKGLLSNSSASSLLLLSTVQPKSDVIYFGSGNSIWNYLRSFWKLHKFEEVFASFPELKNENYLKRKSIKNIEVEDYHTQRKLKKSIEVVENTLACLFTSSLISQSTHDKIKTYVDAGMIYRPFEVLKFAGYLTKNEEQISKKTLKEQVRRFHREGIISIQTYFDFEDKYAWQINELSDLTYFCKIGITIDSRYFENFSFDALKDLLKYIFKSLPFYESHKLIDFQYCISETPGFPLNKKYETCLIIIEFNGQLYRFVFSTENIDLRVNQKFGFEFICAIIETIWKPYRDNYKSYFITNTFLGLEGYKGRRNFHSFTFFHTKRENNPYFNIIDRKIFENKLTSSNYRYFAPKEILIYCDSIFAVLDKKRFKNYPIEKFKEQAILIQLESMSNVLGLIPHFITYVESRASIDYEKVLKNLEMMSFGVFSTSLTIESQPQSKKLIKIKYGEKHYSNAFSVLSEQQSFLELIDKIQNENNLGGRFYNISHHDYEDVSFISFLTSQEKIDLIQSKLVNFRELSEIKLR